MAESAKTFPMLAQTLFGMEPIMAEELKQLGATDILPLNRAVSFNGDKALLYKANLWLRTAIRVLVPLYKTEVNDEKSLYRAAKKVDWQQYLDLKQTFAVHSAINSEYFSHSKFAALKVKDAIADQFRQRTGERPNVDTQDPDISIQVHIFKDQCTFSLDSSGTTLHKRGYKTSIYRAPLSECLAAGIILHTGWDKQTPLYDPMCGSGTLLTEAALIARNIAPGLYREGFGFQNWADFDKELWQQLLKEARMAEVDNPVAIIGTDVDGRALEAATANLESAELEDAVTLKQIAFEQSKPPAEEGIIICNPPYGERIEKADIIAFYQMMGDTLKQEYKGWDAWVFSGNLMALKRLGLRPSKKIPLYNGPLECKLHQYELFSGKRIEKLKEQK